MKTKSFLLILLPYSLCFGLTIDKLVTPTLGFGTYPLTGADCTHAVKTAIENGYQIIDTATFYNNFEGIRDALRHFERNSYYVISKVWPSMQTPEKLKKDLDETLQKLGIDYLDAYLLHWPDSRILIKPILSKLQKLKNKGLIKSIGLSNVTIHHLKRALEMGIEISWVQVEMNPNFYDEELLEFCKKNSIKILAWAPLARGKLANSSLLSKIGAQYGKTASQVALKWICQHNCIPLPGSKNKKHIQENFALDFSLSSEDMKSIDLIAQKGTRERVPLELGLGFADEFDYSYDQCWPKG